MSTTSIPAPHKEEEIARLKSVTPARVGVWRAGSRPTTRAWIDFRIDHAAARDAVHSELSEEFVESFAKPRGLPVIKTLAADRHDFVLNPPKGKVASESAIEALKKQCPRGNSIQIVISDGLSAQAVEANVAELLDMIEAGLKIEGITCGTPVVVRYGRVAVADRIGHALGAKLAINLIGERPGLSSGVGLSAYLTYNPGPETISSDRTVVSNIHDRGTPPVEAGAYIVHLAKLILEKRVSGVRLQQAM